MGVTVAGWAFTVGVVLALFSLDLVLATIRPHSVGYREAAVWSAFYIAVAVIFGLVFASQVGWGYGSQYFAGYIVEKSLSVDNLFIFVIIMATLAVPPSTSSGYSASALSPPWPSHSRPTRSPCWACGRCSSW